MNRNFEYLASHGVVLVETAGTYNLADETETVEKIVNLAKEKRSSRLMFDCRASNVIANIMDYYDRPAIYEKHGLSRASTKIAILISEITEDLVFYETVCMNRGWNVRIFTDYDTVIEWLKK